MDTAFTLGISHPAGFPTYNLLAKAFTYLPVGSLAIKVNLFSALAACLALVCLYWASLSLLKQLYPNADPAKFVWPSVLPAAILAFSFPFWFNSLVAEVYTLHMLFVCAILLLLFLWKEKQDVRYLFSAALVFGLGSGNHATLCFLLPSILILYFSWNRQRVVRNLAVSVIFFLVGLSVYTYLPVRSLSEPSMDWGNPETLQGFLYQVTDRKDAGTHFSYFRDEDEIETGQSAPPTATESIWQSSVKFLDQLRAVCVTLFTDLNRYLSPLAALGFFIGGWICMRKSAPLFFALLILAGINVSFFITWGMESFFSVYAVACLFTSIAVYRFLFEDRSMSGDFNWVAEKLQGSAVGAALSGVRWRRILLIGCLCFIPLNIAKNYYQVDRSRFYFGDTIYKRIFLSLENRSVFINGISWFHFYYYNDVMRFRDDVTQINVWDLLNDDPYRMLTPGRYPDLDLPDPSQHRFDSRMASNEYLQELLDRNQTHRPILVEQNQTFFAQFPSENRFEPYRNVLLKYSSPESKPRQNGGTFAEFQEFSNFIEAELRQPGIQTEGPWIAPIAFYINSFAKYFHAKKRYEEERKVLHVMNEFLDVHGLGWNLRMIENLLSVQKISEARSYWEALQKRFPEKFETFLSEGLLLRFEGNPEGSLEAFRSAARLKPESFRPHLEMAVTYRELGNHGLSREAVSAATKNARSMSEYVSVQKIILDSEKD